MEREVAAIRAEAAPETVWQLEHPAVLTAGTSARDGDLLDPGGLPVHRTGRGGQWTWHGPGQRIGYAMLDLTRPHGRVPARDLRAYVHGLEDWLVAALARLGVRGETRPDRVGIWVVDPTTGAENKIAAIGVRITRWVSWHGVALNVDPDLSEFGRIVPCGIAGHGGDESRGARGGRGRGRGRPGAPGGLGRGVRLMSRPAGSVEPRSRPRYDPGQDP